jgi:hypothetical protein
MIGMLVRQFPFFSAYNTTPEQVSKLLTFCADKNHSKITIYETPYESLDFSPVFWDNGL